MTYLNPVLPVLMVLLAVAVRIKNKRLAAGAIAGLFLWSWPPFAWLLAGTLEWQSSPAPLGKSDAQVIVVLAGNVLPANPAWTRPLASQNTNARCRYAAWLHRNWRPLPVLATGGHIRVRDGELSFSGAMAELLQAEGVPGPLVWTEDQSTSTHENALYTARILRSRGIRKVAVVTEAYHMPRAIGCFRKQGLEVLPAPCGARTATLLAGWKALLPSPSMMVLNDEALHEWAGIAWYKLSGKI